MSTETETKKPTVINWALLHELVLRANTAKDFKTLGEAMEVLSGIMSEFPPYFGDGCAQSYFQSACSKAAKYMADKLFAWLENPPPIAPQETQIGPGNPFPIPPPPPPPTVAHGEWTGALVFERIAPKGLTNPVGYRAATPEEQAELDRIARAINRNTPLFEPRAENTVISGEAFYKALQKADGGSFGVGAPSCAWEMLGHKSQDLYERAAKIAADTARSKTEPGPAGYADKPTPPAPGSLDHAAQNAKAIERAAEPVKTPEPWTGDELYEAFRQAVWGAGKKEDWQRFSDSVRDDFLILTMLVNQRMGIAAK